MRPEFREQLNAATNLSVASSNDPKAAFTNMRHVASLLSTVQPAWNGDAPANQIIVPTQQAVVTITTTLQQPTSLIPIIFPGQGRVVAISGTCAEGDEYKARVQMSIIIDGSAYPFSTGKGQGFVPLSFFSSSEPRRCEWFPFEVEIKPNTQWQIQFVAAFTATPDQTYHPLIGFLYENDVLSGNR